MGISFLFSFSFCFYSFFSSLYGLFRQLFCHFAFPFLGDSLLPASCIMSWTCIHSSSDTLSDLIPWIYSSLPLYNHKIFYFSHTRMVYCFPHFLKFKSEFSSKEFMICATISFWSCFLPTVESFSIFGCKECNQSILGIDHLVMSMCRVVSYVVGRGCLLWPVRSLGKILLAFTLLHSVLQDLIFLLLQVFLDFVLLHSSPL